MTWHLKDKPWDVQVEAQKRSQNRDRYGWFLEQGLGKTSLALNEFIDRNQSDLMLVLAPNSMKTDWVLAPRDWGRGDMRVGMWPKDPLPRSTDGLYVINYEAARTGQRGPLRDLLRSRRVHLVLDESSAIKNPSSDTAKAIMELAKDAHSVRELNGTPMVQNVLDYFAQLKVLGELDRVNPYQFRNRYALMGGYMGKKVVGINPDRQDELYEILDRCSFRALKKDWRDLPPQIDVPVHLEMTSRQKRHYDEMMREFFTMVNGAEIEAPMVLTQMDKLRQLSSGIALSEGKAELVIQPSENPKIKATLDLIQGGIGKVIVVHVYRATGSMLMDELARQGLNPAYLQGQMKQEEIAHEKERFNSDPGCRVIVCQEAAACRGHTLLGGEGTDRCTRMVFFENSFSLLERSQMRDRNHRGAQDQTCHYYDLITSPMDAIIIEALVRKKSMADAIDDVVKAVRLTVC